MSSAGVLKGVVGGHADSVCCVEILRPKKLLISGGEDGLVCLADLTTQANIAKIQQQAGEAVTSVCPSPCDDYTLFAAAGSSVLAYDLRRGLSSAALASSVAVNADEINSLAATAAHGGWVAAADDAGEVQVISLQSFGLGSGDESSAGGSDQQGAQHSQQRPRPSYKTLRRGHANIVSAVAFRPNRPWELLSGGLDSRLLRWDFSRLRPQQAWDLGEEAAAAGGQVFNPPMVHALAVPHTDDRSLGKLMAVARGDGCVAVYDADARTPALPSAGSSRRGGSSGGKGRQKGGTSGGAAVDAARAATLRAEAAAPGRLCLLGPEQGGHTAAANCVSFLYGSQWRQLLSGSNDCRLLLWDWQRAAEAATAAGEAAAEMAAAAEGCVAGGGAAAEAAVKLAGHQGVTATEVWRGRSKVNWACSQEGVICVADTSPRLTLLSLQ